MMKRVMITTLMVVLFLGLFTACSSKKDDLEKEELKQQVQMLQKEVEALKGQTNDAQQPVEEESQTAANVQNQSETVGQASVTPESMEQLRIDVAAAVETAKAIVPTGTAQEQSTQFVEAISALKAVEAVVDSYDDLAEKDYRNSIITKEEYRLLEKELDDLEDQLDRQKDDLELQFGMDD